MPSSLTLLSSEQATEPVVSANPLYRQIQAKLVASLRAGEWKPGEVIPSEMELALRYQVSQGTVRKAIDAMAKEHVLVRRQGRGTFVATHAEQQQQYRFLRLRPDAVEGLAGQEPAERTIVSCEKIKTPADVAHALGLRAGEWAMRIERVLAFAQDPTILEHIWLPMQPFKNLRREQLQADTRPMYAMFEAEYGISMVRAQEQLKAVAADHMLAQILRCKPGAPLLMVQRIAYAYEDQPMELRLGWYKTTHQHYLNEIA